MIDFCYLKSSVFENVPRSSGRLPLAPLAVLHLFFRQLDAVEGFDGVTFLYSF